MSFLDSLAPKRFDWTRAGKVAVLSALGYSQAEIGREISISQQTVSRIARQIRELAESVPSPYRLFVELLVRGGGVEAMAALNEALSDRSGGPMVRGGLPTRR